MYKVNISKSSVTPISWTILQGHPKKTNRVVSPLYLLAETKCGICSYECPVEVHYHHFGLLVVLYSIPARMMVILRNFPHVNRN